MKNIMKKKIGIITIIDNNNYGNRLQNYAMQEYLKKKYYNCETIVNYLTTNKKENNIIYLLRIIKVKLQVFKDKTSKNNKNERGRKFQEFNKNIIYSKKYLNLLNKKINTSYDFFITGSDQVWNPNFARLQDADLLVFADSQKRISFSASFGIDRLDKKYIKNVSKSLIKFKAISVREDDGKKIAEELTNRNDIEVLVDPTMLLNADEWDKVSKRPEQLKNDRYILNYFLGELSEKRRQEIEKIAKENKCEIINILDKNSPFYQTGPSEFIYLEKNAFLICTDSFHSCVFAIIYNKPFIVFDREDNTVSMNSRIETLLNKFKLQDRKYTGKIDENLLKCNYENAYKILEEEKKKADAFLKKALDIGEN